MLRAMVESPAAYQLMTNTESGLFEVTVRNLKYVGQELRNLPYIDKMTVSRIYRQGKPLSPHGDTVIEAGDHILFTGSYSYVGEIRQTFAGSDTATGK